MEIYYFFKGLPLFRLIISDGELIVYSRVLNQIMFHVVLSLRSWCMVKKNLEICYNSTSNNVLRVKKRRNTSKH